MTTETITLPRPYACMLGNDVILHEGKIIYGLKSGQSTFLPLIWRKINLYTYIHCELASYPGVLSPLPSERLGTRLIVNVKGGYSEGGMKLVNPHPLIK